MGIVQVIHRWAKGQREGSVPILATPLHSISHLWNISNIAMHWWWLCCCWCCWRWWWWGEKSIVGLAKLRFYYRLFDGHCLSQTVKTFISSLLLFLFDCLHMIVCISSWSSSSPSAPDRLYNYHGHLPTDLHTFNTIIIIVIMSISPIWPSSFLTKSNHGDQALQNMNVDLSEEIQKQQKFPPDWVGKLSERNHKSQFLSKPGRFGEAVVVFQARLHHPTSVSQA